LPTVLAEDLIHNLVDDARLEPINVLLGYLEQVCDAREGAMIPDISLFALNQVLEIEVRDFPLVEDAPNQGESNQSNNVNEVTFWRTAEQLTQAFKPYGLYCFNTYKLANIAKKTLLKFLQ
jgi:hypothetical protein